RPIGELKSSGHRVIGRVDEKDFRGPAAAIGKVRNDGDSIVWGRRRVDDGQRRHQEVAAFIRETSKGNDRNRDTGCEAERSLKRSSGVRLERRLVEKLGGLIVGENCRAAGADLIAVSVREVETDIRRNSVGIRDGQSRVERYGNLRVDASRK